MPLSFLIHCELGDTEMVFIERRISIVPLLRVATLTAGVLAIACCSTCQAEDLSGYWEGRWKSHSTGHNGPLKATFSRINDAEYRVDFRGRFFKLVPFRYSVTLGVVEEGDIVKLAGSSYLGRMVGVFHYDAEATGCKFTADYSSCKDCGVFVLHRCCKSTCHDGCGCGCE